LTTAALALTAAWIAALGFVLGRSTYQVTVDVARLRVTVGDKAFGGLTIANIGPRAVLASDFVLPVGRGRASFRAPRLAPGQDHRESFQIPTQRRAVVPLGPVRSSRGDPLGLLRRDLLWSQQLELFVHPLTVSLEGSSAGFLKDLEGRPTDTLSSSDVAFHALRDYVMGDDLRHVHWKTSARLGKLMVRQFEETRRSHLVVCLAMDEAEWPSPEAFELGVSLAASLGRQALHEDKDLTIRAGGRQLQTATEQRLLDDFSRLDFGGPREPLEMVAQAAAADAPDASVAVLVAGSNLSGGEFHSAARRFPVDVATVLVRVEPGLALGRGAIASSAVLTVGALGDFPRAFRSLGA
ncbi:MAG: DUF58 domain-containing protein, partial [Propionibacteriaceae bacterium]|nr:DUF58 domain-containing protein [Propionibacteriaceae bacterium]